MSFLSAVQNPWVAAFAGGLLYGIAVCTASCLPYVTGYIAGIGAGFRKGVGVTLIFNSGRITAYALIGALVGAFKFLVNDAFLSSFQMYSSIAFSVVTIVIGASILFKSKAGSCECDIKKIENHGLKKIGKTFDTRAFTLGLSRGLIVCPPLLALLLYTIPFAGPVDSLVLAILFGLGTALSPILFLGGATGWLLNKAPLLRKWISIFGAGVLIVLGLVALLTAII